MEYQCDWENSGTIKIKMGKRRRIKFANKVDSVRHDASEVSTAHSDTEV